MKYLLRSIFYAMLVFLISCTPPNTSEIRFVLSVPDSTIRTEEGVFIASNLNGWNPSDSSFMLKKQAANQYVFSYNIGQLSEAVSFPLTVEYKYTKGSWDCVEKTISGQDVSNRTFLLLNKTTSLTIRDTVALWGSPRVSTATTNVLLLEENFFIPTLQRYRKIWVYLPLDYEKNLQKRYPVLYMHDGQNLFDNAIAPFGEWQIDETLNRINAEMIVVGIEHGGAKRLDEYSPYKNEKYGGGEGEKYLDFIVHHLKPHIDKKLRTRPEPSSTWIGGSSMGGLISFYATLKYPDTFGKGLIFSPSFWFSDSLYLFAEKITLKKTMPSLYLLAGGKEGYDVANDIKKMEAILRKKKFTDRYYRYKFVETGIHRESFWANEFLEAFQWLYKQ